MIDRRRANAPSASLPERVREFGTSRRFASLAGEETRNVILASEHRAQLEREAREALPRECCGLIEGVREHSDIRVTALHPARNLSPHADAFAIDPEEQFRLLRALRGTGHEILGCYHSHPGGGADPSERDRDGAGEDGSLWLIAGGGDDAFELGAYIWSAGAFAPVSIIAAR
jgi:proteasome lid subunit RPN8/RPN11